MSLRYSRTAIKELSRMYRAVLKHCLLIALSWGMTVGPVLAESGTKEVTSDTTWDSYSDTGGTITVKNATLTVTNSVQAKDISLSAETKETKVTASTVETTTLSFLKGSSSYKDILDASSSLTVSSLLSVSESAVGEVNYKTASKIEKLELNTSSSLTFTGNDTNSTLTIKNFDIKSGATLNLTNANVYLDYSNISSFSNEGTFNDSAVSLTDKTIEFKGAGTLNFSSLALDEDSTLTSHNTLNVSGAVSSSGAIKIVDSTMSVTGNFSSDELSLSAESKEAKLKATGSVTTRNLSFLKGTSDYKSVLETDSATDFALKVTNLFSLSENVVGEVDYTTASEIENLKLNTGSTLTFKGNNSSSTLTIKNLDIKSSATLDLTDSNVYLDYSTISSFSNDGTFKDSSDVKISNNLTVNGTGTLEFSSLTVDSSQTLESYNNISVKKLDNNGIIYSNSTFSLLEGGEYENKSVFAVKSLNIGSDEERGVTFTSGKDSRLIFYNLNNYGTLISNKDLYFYPGPTDQAGNVTEKSIITNQNGAYVYLKNSEDEKSAENILHITDKTEVTNNGTIDVGLLDNKGTVSGKGSIFVGTTYNESQTSQNTGSITGTNLTVSNLTFNNTGYLELSGTLELYRTTFENTGSTFSIANATIDENSILNSSQSSAVGKLSLSGQFNQTAGNLVLNSAEIKSSGVLQASGEVGVVSYIKNEGIINGKGTINVHNTVTNYKSFSAKNLTVQASVTNETSAQMIVSEDASLGKLVNNGTFEAQNVVISSSVLENTGTMTVKGTLTNNGTASSSNTGTLKVGSYVSKKGLTNSGTVSATSMSMSEGGLTNTGTIQTTDLSMQGGDFVQDTNSSASLQTQNITASSGNNFKIENGSLTVENTLNLKSISDVIFDEGSTVKIGTFLSEQSSITNSSNNFTASTVDLKNYSSMTNAKTMSVSTLNLSGSSSFNNNGSLKDLTTLKIEDSASLFTNLSGQTLTFNGQMNNNGHFINDGTVSSFNGNIVAGSSAKITSKEGTYTDDSAYQFTFEKAKVTASSGAQFTGNYAVADNGSLDFYGDVSTSNNIFKLGNNTTTVVYTNTTKFNTLYNAGENNTLNMYVDSYKDESFTYTLANTFYGSDFDTVAQNNLYNVSKTSTPGTYAFSKKSADELSSGLGLDSNQAKAVEAMMAPPSSSSAFNSFSQNLLRDMQHANSAEMAELSNDVTLMNPETAPVIASVSQEITNQVYTAVSTRLSGGYISAFDDETGMAGGEDFLEGWSTWTQLLYSKGKYSESDNGFSSRSMGFALGIENYYDYDVKYGFGYSFTKTKVDVDTGRDTDSKTHTLFVYGEYSPSEWFFNDIMTYSFMTTDEKASVKTASYDSRIFTNQIIAGYQFQYDDFDLVPSVGLRYMHVQNKAYNDSLSNKITPGDSNTFTGVIGFAIGTDFDYQGMYFRPELRLAYTYDFVQPDEDTAITLANGNAYTVRGVSQKRDGYEVGVSMIFDITDEVEFSLNYEGHFKKGYRENTGMINFKYEY